LATASAGAISTPRALALARSDHIGVDDLPPELGAAPATVQTADEIRTLAEVERDYIAGCAARVRR
jgi:hypothetical protein